MKRKGLGKGVGALLGENRQEPERESIAEKEVEFLPVSMIEPNPLQPRKTFEEDSLLELAESIKNFGVLQPILVIKKRKPMRLLPGSAGGERLSWQA